MELRRLSGDPFREASDLFVAKKLLDRRVLPLEFLLSENAVEFVVADRVEDDDLAPTA